MAKLTIEQLKGLATLLGVQGVEIVDKEELSDYDEDTLLSEIDQSRLKILKPQIEAELKDNTKKAAEAAMSGTISSVIARMTGISRSELAKLPSDAERLTKGLEFYSSKMGQDTEGLRKEIEDLIASHNDAIKTKDDKIKEVEASWKSKYTERESDEAMVEFFNDVPIAENADKRAVAKMYKKWLAEQHYLHYDEEKKTVELRDAADHEKPVYNEGKSKLITPKDRIEEFLKPLGLLKTSTSHKNPAEEMEKRKQEEYKKNNPLATPLNPVEEGNKRMLEYKATLQAQAQGQ